MPASIRPPCMQLLRKHRSNRLDHRIACACMAMQIASLSLSPDGGLLLAIDADGRSLLINKRRRVLLHHFSFKGPVAAARFSPDGQYIAAAVGRLLQAGTCVLRRTCSACSPQ